MTYVSTFLCMANESEAYSHSNLEKNLGDGSLFCDSYQLTQIYSKRQKNSADEVRINLESSLVFKNLAPTLLS